MTTPTITKVEALAAIAELAIRQWEAWVDDQLEGTTLYADAKLRIARQRDEVAYWLGQDE